MNSVDRKIHNCTIPGCTASYSRPSRLTVHMLSHYNVKGFQCQVEGCGRSYTTNSHLVRHMRINHEKSEKSDIASHSCTLCDRVYTSKQNLRRHINNHLENDSKLFKCEICYQPFSKEHMLITHMYTHTGVKGFMCDYCSESFVTQREKYRHLRYHKTYECKDCTETFLHWNIYRVHRKSVHAKKVYICDYCDKSFKARSFFIRHLRTHEPLKNVCFVCPLPFCNKFYTTKFNLKHHIRSAHMDLTFDCEICGAKLSTKAKLQQHVGLHSDIPRPKPNKVPKPRATRKDKGIPKTSVAFGLAGIHFLSQLQDIPIEIE